MSQHHNHIILMQLQQEYHTIHGMENKVHMRDSHIENIANKSRVYLLASLSPYNPYTTYSRPHPFVIKDHNVRVN
jgi:hypothetical protein